LGIDLSHDQVEQSKMLGVDSLKVGDIRDVLQSGTKADAIIAIDLLEHFTREEALDLLDLIMEALNPGGVLIARCPNVDAPMGSVFAKGDLTHDLFLNKGSAEQLLKATGFTQVSIVSAHVETPGLIKNLIRKWMWFWYRLHLKVVLFASGRSSQHVIFTPNLILVGRKF
jgi:2-polyprenyl-3-methyl-5-hydroxy-6-metoxy-1,4-benzoquinol methylase